MKDVYTLWEEGLHRNYFRQVGGPWPNMYQPHEIVNNCRLASVIYKNGKFFTSNLPYLNFKMLAKHPT